MTVPIGLHWGQHAIFVLDGRNRGAAAIEPDIVSFRGGARFRSHSAPESHEVPPAPTPVRNDCGLTLPVQSARL